MYFQSGIEKKYSDTKVSFEGLVDAFSKCPQFFKDAETLQNISF